MRRRRQNLDERNYEEFQSWAQTQPVLRLRWYLNDTGMTYYKRAGLAHSRGDHMRLVSYLAIALMFKPSMLWKRLWPQLRDRSLNG